MADNASFPSFIPHAHRVNTQSPNNTPASTEQTTQDDLNKDNTNHENNVDHIAKMWQDDDKPLEDKDKQQTVVIREEDKKVTPNEQWKSHVEGLKLTDGIDTAKIQADLLEGNAESLHAALNSVAENSYRNAIATSNQLFDRKIEDAINTAVTKAVGATQSETAVGMLKDRLPFTADPAIEPVAKGVMARLIKKGSDIDEAIEGTRQFFSRVHKLSSKDLKLQSNAPDGTPNGAFHGSVNFGDETDDIDWLERLGGVPPSD